MDFAQIKKDLREQAKRISRLQKGIEQNGKRIAQALKLAEGQAVAINKLCESWTGTEQRNKAASNQQAAPVPQKTAVDGIVMPAGQKKRDSGEFQAWLAEILELWQTFCAKHPTVPALRNLSKKRIDKLRLRYSQTTFCDFAALLAAVEAQPFLMGDNERGWLVSFDWLIENDTNHLKALEKRYVNAKQSNTHTEFLQRKYAEFEAEEAANEQRFNSS